MVELLRIIRVQRRSAIHARAQAANQVHAFIASAPEVIRARLRDGTIPIVVSKLQRRRTFKTDSERLMHEVLRALAKRWSRLAEEIALLDTQINTLVRACAPGLLARRGIGLRSPQRSWSRQVTIRSDSGRCVAWHRSTPLQVANNDIA